METNVWPSVSIGGNRFQLKLTLAALRRLEEWGVDLNKTFRVPTEEQPRTSAEANDVNRTLCTKAAAYAHIETAAGKLSYARLTPEEVEDTLTLADIGIVAQAVAECEGKAVRDAALSQATPANAQGVAETAG